MMNLFIDTPFIGHSGGLLEFKIECDALTHNDLATLAKIIMEKIRFKTVIGVPQGGLRLANVLAPYSTNHYEDPILIVDDVLTTGLSMDEMRKTVKGESVGVVIFARTLCPDWIIPIFSMAEFNEKVKNG